MFGPCFKTSRRIGTSNCSPKTAITGARGPTQHAGTGRSAVRGPHRPAKLAALQLALEQGYYEQPRGTSLRTWRPDVHRPLDVRRTPPEGGEQAHGERRHVSAVGDVRDRGESAGGRSVGDSPNSTPIDRSSNATRSTVHFSVSDVIPTRRGQPLSAQDEHPTPVLHADCARSFPDGASVRLHGRDDRRSGPKAPRGASIPGYSRSRPTATRTRFPSHTTTTRVRSTSDYRPTARARSSRTSRRRRPRVHTVRRRRVRRLLEHRRHRAAPETDRSRADAVRRAAVNESFLELRIFDEDVAAVDLEIFELEIESIPGGRPATNAVGRTAQYRPSGRQPACSHGLLVIRGEECSRTDSPNRGLSI